jgi:nucleoid DNA-binding protein
MPQRRLALPGLPSDRSFVFNDNTRVIYQLEGADMAKVATKSEILTNISTKTGLSRKQVASVFDGLAEEIKGAVGKKGPGIFAVPGLMKITVIQKPAVKARKGINPFTKLEQMFKAKPARKVIKVRPLKALKDMAK